MAAHLEWWSSSPLQQLDDHQLLLAKPSVIVLRKVSATISNPKGGFNKQYYQTLGEKQKHKVDEQPS